MSAITICPRMHAGQCLRMLWPTLHHFKSTFLKNTDCGKHSGCPISANNSWSRSIHTKKGSGSGRGRTRTGKAQSQQTVYQDQDASERAAFEDPHDSDSDSGYHSDSETNGHEPVMLGEVMSFFAPTANQVFVDMTFGGGGHTQALLRSAPGVTVYALDRDPVAHQIAQRLSQYHSGRLFPLLGRFSEVKDLLSQRGVGDCSVDGILIDAGCSSFQFDSPHRGFSISRDGPLDMRMDADRFPEQPTAADVVNSVDASTLANILRTYGEESHAKKIAQAIVDYRTDFRPFSSTQELATIVSCCFTHRVAKGNRDKLGRRAHTATKTFQALRIFVNNELNELTVGLEAVRDVLRPGGKLAALSFHSLEDRVVKRSIQGRDVAEKGTSLRNKRMAAVATGEGDDAASCDEAPSAWKMGQKKVILPSEEEIEANPRARSAKLRTAIKAEIVQ